MSSTQKTILYTCVGGEYSPYVLQSLQESKYEIITIGIDNDPNATGQYFCNFFYESPLGNSKNYIKFISEICKKHSVDFIIPTSDEEAVALSNAAHNLMPTRVLAVNKETVNIFASKADTFRALEKHKLPHPKWQIANNIDEALNSIYEFISTLGSVVVKPSSSRGSRNVYQYGLNKSMKDEDIKKILEVAKIELEEAGKIFPLIAMEQLYGPVHDIDMLAFKGEPIGVFPRRRVNSDKPNEGHILLNNQKFIDLGCEIIKKFNLSWLYDCDFMFNTHGEPIIIEINPRQSGSIAVVLASGYKLMDALIDLAINNETKLNTKIPKKEIKIIPYKNLFIA